MKVLHFTETLPGGIASYLTHLSQKQVQAGYDVHVLAPAGEVQFLAPCSALTLHGYDAPKRSLMGLWSLFETLKRHLQTYAYDIVHLHSAFAGFAGRALPLPGQHGLIYCPHGWAMQGAFPRSVKWLFGLIEQVLAKRCDSIIAISQHEHSLARQHGIDDNALATIISGIETSDWVPHTAPNKRLLFVGRYDYQKGFDLLVEAHPALVAKGFEVIAIGAARRSGAKVLPPGLVDKGWLSPSEISAEMQNCDAVLMPSRWEGMSLTALEALRAGRPIVAANVASMPEVVRDSFNGTLMHEYSAQGLVEAVERLFVLDPSALGRNGRELFEARFTSAAMHEDMDRLYRQVAK